MQPFFFSHPEMTDLNNRVRRAEDRARDTHGAVGDLQTQVKDLTRQADYLSCVVVALAELLRDRQGMPAEVINAKVREVEGRGTTVRREAKRCDACGRVSGPERAACMFCEAPFPKDVFLLERRPSSDAITR
jgi:hypothetical protein